MRISDLQPKDVINILDGKRLGHISDVELDMDLGKITAIVLPSGSRFLGMVGRGQELVIPWNQIVKIGTDTILVRLDRFYGEETSSEKKE